MRYLTLLRATADPATPPPPELMEAIMRLGGEASAAGALLDFGGLMPSAAGARVSLAAGDLAVTDGPFAESKESLAGFWILDVKDEARIVEMAAQIVPWSQKVEIRAVPDGPPEV